MGLFSKIALSGKYGRASYAVSAILTAAMSAVVVEMPVLIPVCVLVKLLSVPLVLYLFHSFSKKREIYFWLNLGISRNEYYGIPPAVEFLGFILLMTICGSIGYAIA